MSQTFNLSIPKPCSEKWSSFTPMDGGAFCSSCNKVVVDFTAMTDGQIIQYFQNKKENTCGRFSRTQLKAYSRSQAANVRPGFSLLKGGVLAVIFLIIKPSVSEAQVGKVKMVQVDPNLQGHAVDSTKQRIRGTVKSQEDKSPLPGVNIVLKGTEIGTATDTNGNFEFPQQLKEGDILIFTFIGLRSIEYKIKDERDLRVDMQMMVCMEMDITGEVAVEGIYEEPRKASLWAKVKGLVSR